MTLTLSGRLLRQVLLVGALGVSLLGLAAELAHHLGHLDSDVVPLLSLSYEANLPTWYSTLLLCACGAVLAAISQGARQADAPFRSRWALLAAIFFYLSLDEAVELHERLNALLDMHGIFRYAWTLPAAAALLLLARAYWPFLVGLPARTRRRFVVAGAIYVGGALLVELPLGWWADRAGDENLTYALIDWVEESLELLGATLFLAALVDYLGTAHPLVRVQPGERP